jgi:hypothetical protein
MLLKKIVAAAPKYAPLLVVAGDQVLNFRARERELNPPLRLRESCHHRERGSPTGGTGLSALLRLRPPAPSVVVP